MRAPAPAPAPPHVARPGRAANGRRAGPGLHNGGGRPGVRGPWAPLLWERPARLGSARLPAGPWPPRLTPCSRRPPPGRGVRAAAAAPPMAALAPPSAGRGPGSRCPARLEMARPPREGRGALHLSAAPRAGPGRAGRPHSAGSARGWKLAPERRAARPRGTPVPAAGQAALSRHGPPVFFLFFFFLPVGEKTDGNCESVVNAARWRKGMGSP